MENCDDIVILTIRVPLDDTAVGQLKDDLLQHIYHTKARGLIVDLAAVDVFESFLGQLIIDIASMAGLMGTRVAITGLQPAVAITLELWLELPRVFTAPNVEKALASLCPPDWGGW